MQTQDMQDRPSAPDFPRPMGVPRAETFTEPTLAEALHMTHAIPDGRRDRFGGLHLISVPYGDLPSDCLREIGERGARSFEATPRDDANPCTVYYRQTVYRRMRACALVLAHREVAT